MHLSSVAVSFDNFFFGLDSFLALASFIVVYSLNIRSAIIPDSKFLKNRYWDVFAVFKILWPNLNLKASCNAAGY